jgi:uncharacterized protein (DUF4415 family)
MSRDNPEWSKKDFQKATKHARVSLKHLGETIARKRGRPKLESPKEAIKLRIDADVLASYRKTGTGWQTKINDDLRKARKLKAS